MTAMMTNTPTELDLSPVVSRLSKDAVAAARVLSHDEARFLVDYYYDMQENRKRGDNRVQSMRDRGEPCTAIDWLSSQDTALEARVKRLLDEYSAHSPLGRWARSITGIGPVIAAGLLAHIRIEKCTTFGQIHRFAGLDPTATWEKGQKRPWNAGLKTLCWKIGESFVKVSGNDSDFYGKLYIQRKQREIVKNEAGDFKDQAAAKLVKFKIGKDTEAHGHYSAGRLPPAHIHARAKRWAVKLFLSHYFSVGYFLLHGKEAAVPYPIALGGHADYIAPPNFDFGANGED